MTIIGIIIATVGLGISVIGALSVEEMGTMDALKIVGFGNLITIFGGLFAGGLF